ncbi:MAG: trypsin-like peptidase domain-containing protein [Solirubrobacterales bacterium]|nr:trypsin-like peptidase domain-containing protein [Solirubrobacterales bacterium]
MKLKHDPLWAGDWRPGEPPPAAVHAPEPPTEPLLPPEPPGPPPRRGRRAAMAAGGATILAALAFAAGDVIGNGDGATGGVTTTPAALPAAAKTSPKASGTVAAVYAKAAPAVVSIKTGSGQGTGFLVDRDGTLVTNAHVVGTSTSVQVQFGEDGRPVTGRVLGRDASSDLAVVKIPPSAASGVTPLQLADDRTVEVGDTVVAIGNPFGLDRTATTGIVSATGRSIEAPNGFSISDAIQTDAPINPGNSGGPLLDSAGRVIGVNSQIATSGGGSGNVGVGFAVPSTLVQRVVPTLEQGGAVARPYLGISTADATSGHGAQVGAVGAGGPAAKAGVKTGDVVVALDGDAVTAADGVAGAIADAKPGDRVTVTVERGGQRLDLQVTLGTRPAEAP